MEFTFQDMHTKKYTKQVVWCALPYGKLEESVEEGTKGYNFTKYVEYIKEKSRFQEQSSGKKVHAGVVIFLDTHEKAEFVSGIMSQNGWNVHGTIDDGWSQDRKREVIKQFMLPKHSKPCLIAVKMSAREMENIKANVVMNYDFPDNMEEYDSRLKLVKGAFRAYVWSWFSTSQDELAEEVIKVLLNAKQK